MTSMRGCFALALAPVIGLAAGCAHEQVALDQASCHIGAPPQYAGEEGGHGVFLRVSPRLSAIDPHYTGCQTIWAYPTQRGDALGSPAGSMRLVFIDGKTRRVELDGIVCRYAADGRPDRGNDAECMAEAPPPFPSQPAGCFLQAGPDRTYCRYDGE